MELGQNFSHMSKRYLGLLKQFVALSIIAWWTMPDSTTLDPPNNSVQKNTYFPPDKGGTGIGNKQRFLGLEMKKTPWKSDQK